MSLYIEKIHIEQLHEINSTEVFSSIFWLTIYSNFTVCINGIFNKNKELIGFFYYQKHKRAKLFTHISPPFLSPTFGLYVKEESTNPSKKNTFLKNVNEAIIAHLNKESFDILTLSFPTNFTDMQSYLWAGYEVSPKYTYQLDLLQTEDKILAGMSPERRKNITKSEKDGLIVKESLGCTNSQKLIEQTFVSQGLKYDKTVLSNVFSSFVDISAAIAYSAYEGDKLLATVFCVRDTTKAYYILGGFDNESTHSGAGAFAMWHAIKQAKQLGVEIFDFEGSMHPPIEKYFRGFGGKMTPYFSLNKITRKGNLFLSIRTLISTKK